MKKALFFLLQVSLCTVGYICASSSIAQAQVTSDGTVNTQVTQDGNVSEITGGETRGGNLFHSFQDFSVGTGNEAFFNNANDISNIFSRVTGRNISNIDGLIRANDSASLFLINPAGIVFGNNARLDIGGSFYGSSASSILFEGGEFSAADLENPPLLTINAPIGLGFRDNPGDIVNRSSAQNSAGEFVGLEVNADRTLALVGGDINFEAGEITAKGGNIYLGGLQQAGVIEFNDDGSFSFPQDLTLADLTLSNGADINVRDTGGGNISIDVQNLTLTAGEFGSSFIRAGIAADSTSPEAQVGNIAINVAENISLDNSEISNQVGPEGVGNSGSIIINTGFLELTNGGQVATDTFGNGNAGTVNITATGDITADGENSGGFLSGITSGINSGAEGDAGGVTLSTSNLSLTNGGRVDASTGGTGNAGTVDITATGDITADGEDSGGFPSGITSLVDTGAEGNAGGVTLSTSNLSLTAGGRVDASTFGTGNAGTVDITATGDITADGEDSGGFPSGITSQVNTGAEGDAGGVTLSTSNLSLTNGGGVSASTFGTGDAGTVDITATGDITADGEDSGGFPSSITSGINTGAEGNAGGVTLSTTNLSLTNGGGVSASTFGNGDANNVTINASESISIDGEIARFRSGISANALNEDGSGGNVFITTGNLTIANGGTVEATNFDNIRDNVAPGTGQPGSINITANSIELTDSARIEAATQFAEGESGNIDLNIAETIVLDNNSFISAQAFNNANGGNLSIDTQFIIAFPSVGTGNDFVAAAEQGSGGNIEINVDQIFGLQARKAIDANSNFLPNNTNDIDVSGNVDGNLNINASNIDPLRGTTELPTNIVQPEETSQQACRANRETGAKNGLNVTGKGGVVPDPALPLSSLNVTSDRQTNSTSTIPAPIETSKGKIQPARGIEVTEDGGIRLVAYRTNNAGDRIPEVKQNCGQV